MIATMSKTAILLITLALALPASAQTSLRTTVRQLQGHAALKGATWGVLAVRLSGDTLAAYNVGEGNVLDYMEADGDTETEGGKWPEEYIQNVMELYRAFCEICP